MGHEFSLASCPVLTLPLLLLLSHLQFCCCIATIVFSHGPHLVSPLAGAISMPAGGRRLSRQPLGLESFRTPAAHLFSMGHDITISGFPPSLKQHGHPHLYPRGLLERVSEILHIPGCGYQVSLTSSLPLLDPIFCA